MDLKLYRQIDEQIVAAAKNIKVLTRLSWPSEKRTQFLDAWHKGNPALPEVEYPKSDDLEPAQLALQAAVKALGSMDDPLANYLRDTAESYQTLCQLLQAIGTHEMLEHSQQLYGVPGDLLSDGNVDNLQAAKHFLQQSDQYYRAVHLHESEFCVSAEMVKTQLEARLNEVFPSGLVSVVIDPDLPSKAAAGATRIRLRDETCFSDYDVEQLLQHEAFVHSLTALNGRAQTNIQCFGLGAPRTTGSQEGLATFSELITGAIDIDRMERIALRVVGINMALEGADFIQVFKYFLEIGQSEFESFNSTMRIFRGAPVTGGAAFTKDVVYLHGLMEVHTFFRWALQNQRLELCKTFFAGRMTISDAIALDELFKDGVLDGPKYLPPWMTRTNGLAGYLAFSLFANRINIKGLDKTHRFDKVEDISA